MLASGRLNVPVTENCYYCGCGLTHGMNGTGRTRDHIIPRRLTGVKRKSNKGGGIVWCCRACNEDKGNLTIEEYRVVLAFRYGQISGVTRKFPGEQDE